MRRNLVLLGLLWLALSGFLAIGELGRNPRLVIRWATESEIDTLGFNLYRSADPDGPFRKINPHLILGADDSLSGAEYEYVDSAIEAGRSYFYELHEVQVDGSSHRVELVTGRAQGTRLWILLLSAGGGLVGTLSLVTGTRRRSSQEN
jgi:hypothetical protein